MLPGLPDRSRRHCPPRTQQHCASKRQPTKSGSVHEPVGQFRHAYSSGANSGTPLDDGVHQHSHFLYSM